MERRTVGSLNQVKGVMGLLQAKRGSNRETLAAIREHLAVVSTEVFWDQDTGTVLIPEGTPHYVQVVEFLAPSEVA